MKLRVRTSPHEWGVGGRGGVLWQYYVAAEGNKKKENNWIE